MQLPSLSSMFLVWTVFDPWDVPLSCPRGSLTSEATAPERNTVLLRILNFHGESRFDRDAGRCSGRKH